MLVAQIDDIITVYPHSRLPVAKQHMATPISTSWAGSSNDVFRPAILRRDIVHVFFLVELPWQRVACNHDDLTSVWVATYDALA